MNKLIRNEENEAKWIPTPIYSIERYLFKKIIPISGFPHTHALRKNISYNIQYLQFLNRCLLDIKLTSVVYVEIVKNFIIIGCGIMESLLTYLLIRKGLYKKSEWELEYIMPGNPKKIDDIWKRADTYIYEKTTLKISEMNFDSMLKKSESKKVLGSNHTIYSKLKYLRKLRNKIHLQAIDTPNDTDWNRFSSIDLTAMGQVLYFTFINNIFRPSYDEKLYFEFLERFVDINITQSYTN